MPSLSARFGRSAVIIAGAGNGVGRAIALHLAATGYIVFGTAASCEEAEDLRDASRGRVSLVACDMRLSNAVSAWADGVAEAVGNAGIDILINISGTHVSGPMELLPMDALRHEFEINVFGSLAIINAFLPALRTAHGRIMQIASWKASLSLPFLGPLEASYAAMEVFSAVYRAELKPFGIDVMMITHDDLSTDTLTAAKDLTPIGATMTVEARRLYGKAVSAFVNDASHAVSDGMNLKTAAARVVELAEQRPAPACATIGSQSAKALETLRERPQGELDTLASRPLGCS